MVGTCEPHSESGVTIGRRPFGSSVPYVYTYFMGPLDRLFYKSPKEWKSANGKYRAFVDSLGVFRVEGPEGEEVYRQIPSDMNNRSSVVYVKNIGEDTSSGMKLVISSGLDGPEKSMEESADDMTQGFILDDTGNILAVVQNGIPEMYEAPEYRYNGAAFFDDIEPGDEDDEEEEGVEYDERVGYTDDEVAENIHQTALNIGEMADDITTEPLRSVNIKISMSDFQIPNVRNPNEP